MATSLHSSSTIAYCSNDCEGRGQIRKRSSFQPSWCLCIDLFKVSTEIITKENVERLHLYAKRVRYLALDDVEEAISPHIFYSILHMQSGSCLFSTLSTFSYYFEKERDSFANFPCFSLFAGPALSAIKIQGIVESQEVIIASFLNDVHSIYEGRNLRELELQGQLTITTLECIQSFGKLNSLTIIAEDMEPTILATLFKAFPTDNALQKLNLQIRSKNFAYVVPTLKLGRVRFDNLQSIFLQGLPALVSKILDAVRTKELVSLKVSFKGKDCNQLREDIISCVEKVVYAPALKSLRSIHLHSADGSVPWDAFALLHSPGLPYATEIHVKIDHFSIQPIYCMVQSNTSWQYLEVLTLSATGTPLPLLDLWEIRALCPILKKLSISVVAHLELPIIEEMERRSRIECSDYGMQELDLLPLVPVVAGRKTSRCNVIFSAIVATYIDHLFPNLKKFRFHLEDIDRRSCSGIENIVNQLHASRNYGTHWLWFEPRPSS